MADTMMREMRNAEANIKGALKDKKRKDEMDNQYLHSSNIGTYKDVGLFQIVSVLAVTVALFLVIFQSLWYLLLLLVTYTGDRYYNYNRKRKMYNKKIDYFEMKRQEDEIST